MIFNSKALQHTSFRIGKKLFVVAVGVLAFFLLRGLENAKSDYDKERAQPIVIVEVDGAPASNQEYAVKLEAPTLQRKLEEIIYPPAQTMRELKQKEIGERTSPGVMALETLSSRIAESIREARRTPFDNQEKFVSYLNDRIIVAKDAADKQLVEARNKRAKWFEDLKSSTPEDFIAELRVGVDKQFMERFERKQSEAERSATGLTKTTTPDLIALARSADAERDLEDHSRVSDAAYYNMNGLHGQFVPGFLIQYVKDQKNKSPHPNSISEMVLDERRGGHVIYQVFYLACLGMLVFGILFPIYHLLHALPPFASSVEPLSERAKDLLSRKGLASAAAPEIVRNVALSVAAIGIGAAVVIGNNPVTSPKNIDDIAVAPPHGEVFPPRSSPRPSPSSAASPGSTESPTPDFTRTPDFTPSPKPAEGENPKPFPTPVFLRQTFTLDDARISQLENSFGTFQRQVQPELATKTDLKTDLGTLRDSLLPRVNEVDTRTKGFKEGDADKIKRDVGDLTTSVSTIREKDIPTLATDVSTKIAATNNAITGFREGTQGRSIRSRTKELLGRERYQVTQESYDILHHLICGSGCSGNDEAVVGRLKELKDVKETMRKDNFRKRLGISGGSTPREALILRYTRVPY